jgi:prepilin-type N-terminal cleavage/methylation domain-containing protein
MNKKGFTLVEVMIAVVVGATIMAAVYGLMTMAQRTSSSTDRRVITQQDTRSVLDLMAMEIRMASYNKQYNPTLWLNIPTCWGIAVPTTIPVSGISPKGIMQATATQLAFAMDLDSDNQFTSNNEYIRYSYDGATALSRATMTGGACGAAQNILGGTAPFTNIRNAAEGVPMFRYFSATGELGVGGTAVDINSIRRILITIASETASNVGNTGQPKRMVHSTTVIVRNHVLSPPHPVQ